MNNLTTEQKQLIELLSAYGLTTSKIATTLGLTHEYVQEYFNHLNNNITIPTNESSHIGAVENMTIEQDEVGTVEDLLISAETAEIIETVADSTVETGTDVTPEITPDVTPEPAYAGFEGGETGGGGADGSF